MNNESAIIIGGSIAGLITARVLINYFDRVTIIEKDCLPTKPQFRYGVPQSNQPHMLLSKGQEILEDFFPGLTEELFSKNAAKVNMTWDFPFLLTTKEWSPRFKSTINSIGCSRNLLESTIRDRVKKLKAVHILENNFAIDLLGNEDKTVILGVVIKNKNKKTINIKGDLIVDASGRNSQAQRWLENLGYIKPKIITIDCNISYASRIYRSPQTFERDWKGVFVKTKAPDRKKGGAIFPIENEQWIVVLTGRQNNFPSIKEAEYLKFAQNLPTQLIYKSIIKAKPLSRIFPYRGLKNVFKQYNLMSRFPENFIILGDAFCTFNPVNGQGMTVAALEAKILDQLLCNHREKSSGFSLLFQKKLASIITPSWVMAINQDLAWDLDYSSTLLESLKRKYFTYLEQAACQDPEIWLNFLQVLNLSLSPEALFSPKIFSKVLVQLLKRKFSYNNPI